MRNKAATKLSAIHLISGHNITVFDKLLKSKDLDVNEDLYGSAAVHEVCRYNYLEFLEYLVDHGADINAIDALDRSPA